MAKRHRERKELTPYQQKLLDPRWQKKRLEILQRDEWTCRKCGDKESTLHVHHRYYKQGKDPWDYPEEALGTLCADCHEQETEGRPLANEELASVLEAKGLAWEAVHYLAQAFLHWEIVEMEGYTYTQNMDVNIRMLLWLMNNYEPMSMLYEQYAIYLSQQRDTLLVNPIE